MPNIQNFLELNVIFTMLIGLLLLRSIHEVQCIPVKAVCIVLCLLCGYWCDYGLYGLAMILICDIARDSRHATVLGLGVVVMVSVYLRVTNIFPNNAGLLEHLSMLSDNPRIQNYLVVQLCQLLPLILIARHGVWFSDDLVETRPSFFAKWAFYIFYPAHITALLLIRMFVF